MRFAFSTLICGLRMCILVDVIQEKFPTHVSYKLCAGSITVRLKTAQPVMHWSPLGTQWTNGVKNTKNTSNSVCIEV